MLSQNFALNGNMCLVNSSYQFNMPPLPLPLLATPPLPLYEQNSISDAFRNLDHSFLGLNNYVYKPTCLLNAVIHKGHAFLDFKCKDITKTIGFYPFEDLGALSQTTQQTAGWLKNHGTEIKAEATTVNTPSMQASVIVIKKGSTPPSAVGTYGSVQASTFQATAPYLLSLPGGAALHKSSLLGGFQPGSTTFGSGFSLNKIPKLWTTGNTLGSIRDESKQPFKYMCKLDPSNCVNVEFELSEKQLDKVSDYIEEVHKASINQMNKCAVPVLNRIKDQCHTNSSILETNESTFKSDGNFKLLKYNCVDFMSGALNAAGIEGWEANLKQQISEKSYFSRILSLAWNYFNFKF